MEIKTKVSICVPTYKQPEFLKRLFDSISLQTFKNIEVIVSDDSPDESVKDVVDAYQPVLSIQYYNHSPALKSPRNWNFALDKASGDLVMLVHHDDWFAQNYSIEKYVEVMNNNSHVDFVYSKNTMVLTDGSTQKIKYDYDLIKNLDNKPDMLLFSYVVGPPSNIMVRKKVDTRYDERFIWLVDVDYCVRTIKNGHKTLYINESLVNIGMHPEQTTVFCNNNPHIVLRENILFAEKVGASPFSGIIFYDYYWRLLRNHSVRKPEDIISTGVKEQEIISPLKKMIGQQQKISPSILKIGAFSKFFMLLSYLKFKNAGS